MIHERERLAFDMLIYTGLRRGDVVRVGRQHVNSNNEIVIRTEKKPKGKTVGTEDAKSPDKNNILRAVATLADQIRTTLGDTAPESAKLAEAETFTSGSLEATHEYAEAQEARYAGKTAEAIKGFRRAVELDPNFGSAYGNLGALYWNEGNQADAINYYKLAMQHIDRMTDREKYRTRGGYYLAVSDGDKAVEEFSALVKQYPADSMGLSALAHAYYLRHDMAQAVDASRRAVEIYPKNVVYRTNASLYALFASDYDTSEREAQAVLQINPIYEDAYTILALCETAKGNFDQANQHWHKVESLSAGGASSAAGGLADLALYRSDPEQAISALKKGIDGDTVGNSVSRKANLNVHVELRERRAVDVGRCDHERSRIAARPVGEGRRAGRSEGVEVRRGEVVVRRRGTLFPRGLGALSRPCSRSGPRR